MADCLHPAWRYACLHRFAPPRLIALLIALLVVVGQVAQAGPSAAVEPWSGTVSLTASRAEVDSTNPSTVLTVSASPSLTTPYRMSIYEGTTLVYLCGSSGSCGVGITLANNSTHTYTAYVAQDAPAGAVPSVDVRATSASVTVRHTGWNGAVSLNASRITVDATDPTTLLTVSAAPDLAAPYKMSIYDGGALLYVCGAIRSCAWGLTLSSNTTHEYTAYVAQDAPAAGPPLIDVRGMDAVTVSHIGWGGTVAMTASKGTLDDGDVSISVAASSAVNAPYVLSLYRLDSNSRIGVCTGTSCSATIPTSNAATVAVVAYVARSAPAGGPPAGDISATAHRVLQNSTLAADAYAMRLMALGLISPGAVCDAVATIPQPRTPSSGSTGVYTAECYKLAAANATVVQLLRALVAVAAAADAAQMLYLVLDAVMTNNGADPDRCTDDVVTTGGGPLVPGPVLPGAGSVGLPSDPDEVIYQSLRGRRQGPATIGGQQAPAYTEAQLRYIARTCRSTLARTMMSAPPDGQDCLQLRIFLPSVYDAEAPTLNDAAAIASHPAWVRLHYVSNDVKGTRGKWYDATIYRPNDCQGRDPDIEHCDEYPFFSSAEGGKNELRAAGTPVPRLARAPKGENVLEGNALGAMHSSCRSQSGSSPSATDGTPFLVIPILRSDLQVHTGFFCV